MNKIALSVIAMGFVLGLGLLIYSGGSGGTSAKSKQNVEIKDGVQYVTINARGGYSPRASAATALIPTKLVVKTNSTYDCSASLVIPSIGYQKILPNQGEEVIDIGTHEPGTSLRGTCAMGMYNFTVNFN